jgi:type IV secretion system protein VirB4
MGSFYSREIVDHKKIATIGDVEVMRLGNVFSAFANDEDTIASQLPYVLLEQDDILLTAQEERIRVWKISGLPIDTADPLVINEALRNRMQLFAHLPYGQECRITHTLLRTHQPPTTSPTLANDFGQSFLESYYASTKKYPLYENQHYLSLNHQLPLGRRSTFLKHKQEKDRFEKSSMIALQHIEEASRFIEQQLSFVGIERLRSRADGSHALLQFLSRLLNWQDLLLCNQPMDIRNYLSTVRLFFGKKSLEIRDATSGKSWFAALISVKGFASTTTTPSVFDNLLVLPVELCLTQSFSLIPTQAAREKLTLHQRRLTSVNDPDIRGQEQLEEALGAVVAGDYSLGWYQMSVMVVTTDLLQLEDKVALVQHELLKKGLIPIRDTHLMESIYWSQFPGNHHHVFRQHTLHSGNMACFTSLHSKVTGNRQSYWGAPLLLLSTPQRSGYWFNFHVGGRDIGDTLVLGEKGSGKTLLLTTLATAALQYQPRIFFFDKDFGAEMWVHAVGGNHAVLGTGAPTGLNPLQLPDNASNRNFLNYWLRSLLEAFGSALTESELTDVARAIDHNYHHLAFEERTLSNLQSALGKGGPGTLRNRLNHWVDSGELAFYFDNPRDTLAFDNPITAFEMHYLLQESQSKAKLPVLLYLFHRIRLSVEASDNRPTLIFLDEAWSLLANDYFAKEIKNWLLTLRKLNAITIFATQNPADILSHTITPILVAETVTKIIYRPNTPTREVYQEGLHLTEGEYQALCDIPSGSRAFLVKQPDHAVVAQLDLKEAKSYIPLLSSRPQLREAFLKRLATQGWQGLLQSP